ncbi:MAG: sigma-70 family RNA polymerase sigma factor [Betaproteobacteria bacterium]
MSDCSGVPIGGDEIGQHRDKLLRFALRRLRNPAQAEDAVQEALVAAIEGADRYAGNASTDTWLKGILKHKIVDCVRASARDRYQDFDPDSLPANSGNPEAALSRSGFFREVARCMDELPARSARVFFLREVLGLNTAEVCAELSISATNCSVLLHRARTGLRNRLAGDRLAFSG